MEADDDVFRQRAAVVAVVPGGRHHHHHHHGVEEIDDDEETPLIGHLSVQSSTSLTPPDDKKSLVYIVFFLVGMGTLLPWNFFISLNNFWDYKFREVGGGGGNSSEMLAKKSNSTAPSELQKEFTSYLAIASTVPNATFVIINACVGQRFDLRKRIKISLVIIIVMFTFVSALALADSDEWQRAFLVLILILVVIINMNSAIFQGGSFGMAGKFPPAYMGAQMAGQAMGGVFPALVDIVVVAMDVEEKDVGFACFVIATLVLILCLLCLIWAFRSPFFKFYNDSPPATIQDELENDGRLTNPRLVDVLKTCWLYLLSMLLTFTVTLSVFPAVSVLVQAETFASGSLWARQYFTPVCVFLLFNMGDLLGRTLASWIKLPRRSTFGKCVLLLAAVSRIAFIPLFMLCNIPSNDGSTTRVIFGSDADFIAFMALFSLSNGYIGNMCMLNGPKASLDKQMQEAIALVLVAGLVVGTGLGSFISLPLTKAL